MSPTSKNKNQPADEAATNHSPILHLVTPASQGRPLCGDPAPQAAIGGYCEQVADNGEWNRGIFGKGGKMGNGCSICLSIYPSLATTTVEELQRFLVLQSVVTISPYPIKMADEFDVKVTPLDSRYQGESSVVGQWVSPHGVALTLRVLLLPKAKPTV